MSVIIEKANYRLFTFCDRIFCGFDYAFGGYAEFLEAPFHRNAATEHRFYSHRHNEQNNDLAFPAGKKKVRKHQTQWATLRLVVSLITTHRGLAPHQHHTMPGAQKRRGFESPFFIMRVGNQSGLVLFNTSLSPRCVYYSIPVILTLSSNKPGSLWICNVT